MNTLPLLGSSGCVFAGGGDNADTDTGLWQNMGPLWEGGESLWCLREKLSPGLSNKLCIQSPNVIFEKKIGSFFFFTLLPEFAFKKQEVKQELSV